MFVGHCWSVQEKEDDGDASGSQQPHTRPIKDDSDGTPPADPPTRPIHTFTLYSTLRLGRDLPHGFFGLYGLDPSATKIMEEAGAFLQARLLSSDEQETAAAGAGAVLPRSSSSLLMVAAPAEKEDSGSSMSSSSSEAGLKEGEVALLELAGAAHHQGYGNNVGEAAAAGGAPLPLSVTTPQ